MGRRGIIIVLYYRSPGKKVCIYLLWGWGDATKKRGWGFECRGVWCIVQYKREVFGVNNY